MITYLFPGQGAQKTGMGSDLFDRYPEYVKKADQILGYSIRDLCLNGPEEKLSQTNYAQPALFVVNAFSYISQVEHIGAEPDFVAGHSLGEYNALFASQVFDFETGLQLVKKRGELMAEVQDGGMAAVIGLSDDKIEEILRNSIDTIDIANYNTPAQVVISGKKKSIEDAQQIFEKAGARMYIPLKVGGAFHSRYMKEASENFRKFLNDFSFSTIKIPVIANITALPYLDNEIKENLANQICKPVQWLNSMMYLCEFENMLFKEIGESKILTNMFKKIPTVFV